MNKETHYTQLIYQDRQTIAIGRQQGLSMRAIARMLNRAASTISGELDRNQPGPHYSCHHAQQRRDRRRCQARPGPKLVVGNALFETITALLRRRLSPRQIAAQLAKLHPCDAAMRVSHETHLQRYLCHAPRRAQARADCLPAHGQGQTLATLAR